MKPTKKLRDLLSHKQLLIAPGIYNGLSALLAEQAGFSVVYASGGAIARSMGKPDIGLLTLTEVSQQLASITDVVSVPVIADADTGFGNELNVERTVKLFEQAGVAGFHLEDQTFPKRCGHLDGKTLIPESEMSLKIKVACQARSDKDLLVIARTDAIAVEGFEKAIERAQAYLAAGADMIFVEAPQTFEQIELIAKEIPQPKLINMFYGGKTPLVPKEKLIELGYRLVIIPSDLQRAAIRSMQNTLIEIKQYGDSSRISEQLATFNEREEVIGTKDYFERVK